MNTEEKIFHVRQLSKNLRQLVQAGDLANTIDTIADILEEIRKENSSKTPTPPEAPQIHYPVALGRNPNNVRVNQIPLGWRLCRTGEDLEKPWRVWEGENQDHPDGWGKIQNGNDTPWPPENTYIVPDDGKPPQGHSFSCERCHDKKTVISTSHFGNIPCPRCGRQRPASP